jgi:hypothetical protein
MPTPQPREQRPFCTRCGGLRQGLSGREQGPAGSALPSMPGDRLRAASRQSPSHDRRLLTRASLMGRGSALRRG